MILQPNKILAIKFRSLGDTVMMTAALDELRRAFPNSEIHAAVMAEWAPILEFHEAINRLWPFERPQTKAARTIALTRFALQLRKEQFDIVLNFHAGPSSAMASYLSGAKIRAIHFHGHGDKNRFSTIAIPGKGTIKSNIERDIDVLRGLGLDVPAGQALPRLFLRPQELTSADQRLASMGVQSPLLALGLGSSRPTKSWPVDRFAMVALEWCQRHNGGAAVAFVSKQEDDLAKQFLKEVDDVLTDSVPQTEMRALLRNKIKCEIGLPLRTLAAFLSHCSVYVGNDSGPKHIATALGCPTVTMFGPEHPLEWHPYSRKTHPYFFIDGLECRRDGADGMPPWCGIKDCSKKHHQCMRQIGAEGVIAEVERVMRK